jgi:paraquat-inducible protein B
LCVVGFVAEDLSEELIIAKRDKKASLIDITIVDPSENFAFLFNKFLIQEATDLYIELKVGKMRRSVKGLQSRVDSVQRVLEGTMRSSAVSMDQSLGIVSMAPRVSTTKKQMEAQMLGTMFAELTKNLELTKFTLEREEPVIQIVDAPLMPLLKEGKGRVKSAVIGGFLVRKAFP